MRHKTSALSAICVLFSLTAHATPAYYIVRPQSRGGSDAGTAADSISSLADSTTKGVSLGVANSIAAAGRTFILLPGDYSAETSAHGNGAVIAPAAGGTDRAPDSSVRYISLDVYATGTTSSPRNYTVNGANISKAFVNVTNIETKTPAVFTRQTDLTTQQADSMSFCYLAGVHVRGVHTGVIYRSTIRRTSVGPGSAGLGLISVMGEDSTCIRTCSHMAFDWKIRRCTITADSVRQNGKIFWLQGRQRFFRADSNIITGLFVEKPALGSIGMPAAAVHGQVSARADFRDNRWTLDMFNGAGCTTCNTNEDLTDFHWVYLRDSTNNFSFQRDTVNACKGAATKPGLGLRTFWSAGGAFVGPMHDNRWVSCVVRGELHPQGWQTTYQIDKCVWLYNAFMSDSGGSPLRFTGKWGSGNRIEHNTSLARMAPAIVMDAGGAILNPLVKNTLYRNGFVRFRTSRALGGMSSVAMLQSPLSFREAFNVNQNAYYSYTDSIGHAVGWGGSSGSCTGGPYEPNCGTIGCGYGGSPPCWPAESNYLFDNASRWADPLFRDTTATQFSGDIKCFDNNGNFSGFYGLQADSAVGARQPQGNTPPGEPTAYVTDSLGRQAVIDTISTTNSTITFKFIAPPDDAVNGVGTPNLYLCAVSQQPIDLGTFGQSTFVTPPVVAAPGTVVSYTVDALPNRVYYTAVRTIGSCGMISENISANGCAVARGSLVLCE